MPKVAHDFSKEMIFYIIKCNDLEKTEIYVGSTFNFVKRKTQHKSNCTNPKSRGYHFKQYVYIRENGGWDNFNMTMIDRKVCVDMLEVRKHEQTLITQYKASLNTNKAFGAETLSEYKHQHYIENFEKNKERDHKYYIENLEKIKKDQKQYRIKHSEEIKEKNKQNYAKHSSERNQPSMCECGQSYTKQHYIRHTKSRQHQAYLATKESVEIV